jgi:GNAT superfamily N-acetyltransferase
MWRPDRTVHGPEPAARKDVDALNHVFSDAFTERYRRDGLSGVRVPFLNPAIWQFAIDTAGDGAMLWRDARGDVVAFNLAHRSGSEGWMGPLAVRTDRQGRGLGRQIVTAGIDWLRRQGARTIGLETMPRTIDNVGFYSRLGFVPGSLTVTLSRDVGDTDPVVSERLSAIAPPLRDAALDECRALAAMVSDGADYSRELRLTLDQRLGDATLLRDPSRTLRGWALWHTAPLANGRLRDELRILKLAAVDGAAARAVIGAVEHDARQLGLTRMALRCQTEYVELYSGLIGDGFRVQWTDLRMHLRGPAPMPRPGILLTNWEI